MSFLLLKTEKTESYPLESAPKEKSFFGELSSPAAKRWSLNLN
ncbi:hypothetical protein VCHA54P496_310013 [Vibrio chagasii]|nr:hypothetical protein VCHA54P496_310013 [Vibrio chagasii]CAH7240569.1 hypothetical protein VCHA54P495_320019 [Vibrio chagasii]CAH7438010.1 hypothetical protein VCHA54P486_370020 [Vibrio chagasii]